MRNRKNQFIVFSLEFLTLSSNQHFSSLFYYSGFALFMGLDKHTGRQIRQIRQAHRQTDQTDIQVDKLDVRNRQTHRYTDQTYYRQTHRYTDLTHLIYRLNRQTSMKIRQIRQPQRQTDQTYQKNTQLRQLYRLNRYTGRQLNRLERYRQRNVFVFILGTSSSTYQNQSLYSPCGWQPLPWRSHRRSIR